MILDPEIHLPKVSKTEVNNLKNQKDHVQNKISSFITNYLRVLRKFLPFPHNIFQLEVIHV